MQTLIPTKMSALRRQMDQLFDRIWEPEFPEVAALGEWNPIMDVAETKDTLILRVEVPGIHPEDIQVSLQEQVLTIKGEKKKERDEKEERYYRIERSYGSFSRSVRLPIPVDPAKVNATFRNGVLTVMMTKHPEAKGISIPVKLG